MPYSFASESPGCLDALPATSAIACSTGVGWTSLLVRHSRCDGAPDVYDTIPTSDYKLVVVTRGDVNVGMFKGGLWRRATYRPGTMGLSVPGEVDRLSLELRRGCTAFEKLHIFVPQALVEEVADHVRRPGQATPRASVTSVTQVDGAIAQIGGALIAALRNRAPDYVAELAGQWLAMQLLSPKGTSADGDRREPGTIADPRLRRALDFMCANIDQPLTLEAIAAEACVSKFHFTRLFRTRIGRTPMQHLAELRLDAAAQMLVTNDLPVARVALECGHRNAAHFSDAFRRRFGCSPTRYRRS